MNLILSPNFLHFTDHAGLLRNQNEKGLYKLPVDVPQTKKKKVFLFADIVDGPSFNISTVDRFFCFWNLSD